MNRLILFGVAVIMSVCFAVIIGGTIALLDLILN
jgi:hypothetical protein